MPSSPISKNSETSSHLKSCNAIELFDIYCDFKERFKQKHPDKSREKLVYAFIDHIQEEIFSRRDGIKLISEFLINLLMTDEPSKEIYFKIFIDDLTGKIENRTPIIDRNTLKQQIHNVIVDGRDKAQKAEEDHIKLYDDFLTKIKKPTPTSHLYKPAPRRRDSSDSLSDPTTPLSPESSPALSPGQSPKFVTTTKLRSSEVRASAFVGRNS